MERYFSPRFERLHHFDAVSEGIMDIKPVISLKRFILNHMAARCFKCFSQVCQVIDQKRRMGFFRRSEILLDAQVQFYRTPAEPTAAAGNQIGRFCLFRKAKQAPVKSPRLFFTASRHRQLNMVERKDPHGFSALRRRGERPLPDAPESRGPLPPARPPAR